MKTSFIIPAHNEQHFIAPTIKAIQHAAHTTNTPFEIIVADDASTDQTATLARSLGATVIPVTHRQIAKTRNSGAQAATGDLLVFVDADTTLPPQTLAAAIRSITQGSIAGGALVAMDAPVSPGANLSIHLWNAISRLYRWAAGCFVYALPQPFHAVGGFDEQFFASEEIELSKALQKQGPVNILSQHVITSARKLQQPWRKQMIQLLTKTILTNGKSLHQRQGLEYWYETNRNQS